MSPAKKNTSIAKKATGRQSVAKSPPVRTPVKKAAPPPPPVRIATVSHTLDVRLAEHLREFAFRQRVSESAVIEFALQTFFSGGNDPDLGAALRKSGAALRRKL